MKKRKENGNQKKKKSNFGNQFLIDFRLFDHYEYGSKGPWKLTKKALDLFHTPVTYHGETEEGEDHYRLKSLVHDYIYENYYLENECKFLVTTELKQINNPFFSYIDGKIPVYFTLDVCVIRENDCQVFDIEIDGAEHRTRGGMMKADIRDEWLKDRYGMLTWRIDSSDKDINYKKLDKFISQPVVENPRKQKKK